MMFFDQCKGYFPSPTQKLLLQAALGQGEAALKAYESWTRTISLDDVDYGSQMLIPLLYQNFQSQGLPLKERDRLKGIFRYFWTQSQKILNSCQPILLKFNERKIPIVVLKGMALALKYYPTFGVRPMGDLDLMVRLEQVPQAMKVFEEASWKPLLNTQKVFIPDFHAVHYVSPTGEDLDLHWHLLYMRCLPGIDDEIWRGNSPISIHGMDFFTLNDTDHLFHAIIHGFIWSPVAPVRWITDAHFILAKGQINWERLLHLAELFHVSLAIRRSLSFLVDEMGMDIPKKILDGLDKIPVSRWEKREYKRLTRPGRFFGELPALWHRYFGLISNSLIPQPLGFINYLKNWYGFEKRRTLFHFFFAKGMWKLRKKPLSTFPRPFPS